MRDEIIRALNELEERENCRILFAAESGSRAWGFPSPDSDYDIRAIYAKPEAWYWDIAEKQRDTFEAMLRGELDVAAWELRKALRLFGRGNTALYEWFGSPIVYVADEGFLAEMRRLIPLYFNPIRAGHHYLALADNAFASVDAGKEITLKKLFYALRGSFCAMWSVRFQSMPPTEFDRLLVPELLPREILRRIAELKARKQRADEKAAIPLPQELHDFCISLREDVLHRLDAMQFRHPGNDALNQLLQTCVRRSGRTEAGA